MLVIWLRSFWRRKQSIASASIETLKNLRTTSSSRKSTGRNLRKGCTELRRHLISPVKKTLVNLLKSSLIKNPLSRLLSLWPWRMLTNCSKVSRKNQTGNCFINAIFFAGYSYVATHLRRNRAPAMPADRPETVTRPALAQVLKLQRDVSCPKFSSITNLLQCFSSSFRAALNSSKSTKLMNTMNQLEMEPTLSACDAPQ